jgi:hypothetical protein
VARQVLEHALDPVEFLATCRKRLIGGGWLFMELPSATNAMVAVYGVESYMDWWYSEPHLTYWEPETLANLLNVSGFEARIYPLQTQSLAHNILWLAQRVGVSKPSMADEALQPVSTTHPLAPALNRIWMRFDKEYRIQMETLSCANQMRVIARKIEI